MVWITLILPIVLDDPVVEDHTTPLVEQSHAAPVSAVPAEVNSHHIGGMNGSC